MKIIEIIDGLHEEVEFVAKMTGISVESVVENAIEQHLNQRADLAEFEAHIRRHLSKEAEVANRLRARIARGSQV